MKLVPLTVSVNLALPALIEEGLTPVITGNICLMVKVTGSDVPPAVVTVMLAVPGVATRLAGTSATRVDPPTLVVTSGVAFQLMVAVEVKCKPMTVRLKASEPAGTELGFKLAVMLGGAGLMAKERLDEIALTETTDILAVPVPVIRLAGTTAVSWVELT